MNLFNTLTKEEKIRSLIYVTNNELSTNNIIQKKQWEMLEVLWTFYIKDCDYSYSGVRVMKTDKYNIVHTYEWPAEMNLTNLDRLLSEFVSRTEQYKQIYNALETEFNNCRPTIDQEKFMYNFMSMFEDWFTYEPDDFVSMYNNKYFLNNIVSKYGYKKLLY